MRSASWQMLLSTDHFLRTRSEHSSNCRRSPCQKFIFDRDKSRFGRTRRPRTVPNARLRGPSQTQRPSRRSHRIASAVRSCPPRTQPALARKARVPDVQRRVLFGRRSILFWHLPGLYVLSHRARHKVHLALSSRLLAWLQIVTQIQHAILVRESAQLFLPPTTLGARLSAEGEEKAGNLSCRPRRAHCAPGGGRTVCGTRKPLKAPASRGAGVVVSRRIHALSAREKQHSWASRRSTCGLRCSPFTHHSLKCSQLLLNKR